MSGSDGFLDRVYNASGNEELQQLYSDWSDSYDREVTENGYMTPGRCAAALTRYVTDPDLPILDIGCGTGLSGLALRGAGFTNLTGTDINVDMLEKARGRKIYNRILHSDMMQPVPNSAGEFAALSAIGVIGTGAAPPSMLEELVGRMRKGAFLVFSMNDHTLATPEYSACVDDLRIRNGYTIPYEDYGPHLTGLGLNSRVYVVHRH